MSLPLDYSNFEDIRRCMKGYWINASGSLTVTFYVPSRWERVREYFFSRSWVAYPWA